MATEVQLSEDKTQWVLSNASLKVTIDRATGRIAGLVDQADGFDACRANEPNAAMFGGLRVADELTGQTFCDLATASRVSAVEAGQGPDGSQQVVVDKQFDGAQFTVRVTYRMEKDCLVWLAELTKREGADRSVRIVFIVPQPSHRLWGPMADPFIDLQPEQPVMIRHGLGHGRAVASQKRAVPIPLLTFIRERGLQSPDKTAKASTRCMALALPVEVPNVLVRFMNNADETHLNIANSLTYPLPQHEYFKVCYEFLGLRDGKPTRAGVLISAHEGQWRPALAWYAQRYAECFQPDPKVSEHDGFYHPGRPYEGDEKTVRKEMRGRRKRGVHWAELHGHFPFYGLYVSPTEPWQTLSGIERDFAVVRRTIRLYREQGIKVHTYYNTIDGQAPYVEKEFPESIAVDETGKRIPAYTNCWLMNADPETPFGRHCLEQFERLLAAYPDTDGLFYDVYGRHYELDFGHDDGITMVHNKPAYCMKFAFKRLMDRISPKLHGMGKLFSANKPEGIETLAGIDLIMCDEGHNIHRLEAFSYYGLFKPVMVLDTQMWQDPEPTMKICLRLGMMFNDFVDRGLDQLTEEQVRRNQKVHAAYAPLLAELRGKQWVLEPDPLTLPEAVGGNIFRVPDGRVIVTAVSEQRSMFEKGGFTADLSIVVRLSDGGRLTRATVRSPDYRGIVPAKLDRADDGTITVTVPRHRTASIVILEP